MNFLANNNFQNKIFASAFYNFFGILLPYTIVFLLVGEVNLLKLDWNINHQISWQLYTIIFSMTLLGFFWMFVGLLSKTLNWEDFPFLAATVMLSISIFISSLIPLSGNEVTNWLIIIARIFITLFSSLFTFFTINKFIKYIIFKSLKINRIVDKYSKINKSDFESNKKYYKILNILKKEQQKKPELIEVEVKEKK